MRYRTVTILAVAVFTASTVLFCDKLTGLLDAGTCASGNQPFVVARECPAGTETDGLLLGASVIGLLAAIGILAFRGLRPQRSRLPGFGAMVLGGWAIFFTVSGAVSLIHSFTSEVIGPDGETGGIVVGATFLVMGLPVLALVLAALVSRLRGRDERPAYETATAGLAGKAVARVIGSSLKGSGQRTGAGPASGFRSADDAGSTDATLGRLERLQRLRESGALTDAEFESEKARVLGER